MANKGLFQSIIGKMLPNATVPNKESAIAYAMTPKHMLAQYAATGCLNRTFYADANEQLEIVLKLSETVEPAFLAKAAVYARREGYLKDMPALICSILSQRDPALLARVFPAVCDNARMLRSFVQIIRSGSTGRKSLGSRPKKLVQQWFDSRSDEALFSASVGKDPSLSDIIKMVHPVPGSKTREALYGYLIGRACEESLLPEAVRSFEAYKAGSTKTVPEVPFQMLTALHLGQSEWVEIAKNASWQATRMNLNTFARHGVFEVPGMTTMITDRIKDATLIQKARVYPYQLMVAYQTAVNGIPREVRDALQDAMELATENVPAMNKKIYVCPDVSGSMSSPVTGYRKGSSSAVRCIDVAALITACIMRKNTDAEVLPFENSVVGIDLNIRDSIMTNAQKLAAIGGGGTNCSAPLRILNKEKAKGDLILLISDNQSWVDDRRSGATELMREWNRFRQRNPGAKMVCIDVQPYGTLQATDREDILNIGGFSDQIFSVVGSFVDGSLSSDHWVGAIEAVSIE
jgi:60 kDa SS-A/Ro ribonucleoprotein